MDRRTTIVAGLLLLSMAMLVVACEESDVIAPSGSVITLSASPSNVPINQQAVPPEVEGQTSLIARVIDADGKGIQDFPLLFTASAGRLGSGAGTCNGVCLGTTTPCTADAQCPPRTVVTNASGFAFDTLTLSLIGDPDMVEVTVQGGSLAAVLMVGKNVNLGPVDPKANILASPPLGQRTGVPFILDGSSSTFDPLVDLTCFKWTVATNLSGSPTTEQCGETLNALILTLPATPNPDPLVGEQELAITLQVSDEVGVCSADCSQTPPFSQFLDTLTYEIKCDFTNPIVEAGGDVVQSVPNLSVSRSAIASDPQFPTSLTYLWSCSGGTIVGDVDKQNVTCQFPGAGSYNMSVTVSNKCGLSATDGFGVLINN